MNTYANKFRIQNEKGKILVEMIFKVVNAPIKRMKMEYV